MFKFNLFSMSLLSVALVLSMTTGAAADLTENGDFETGDTSGWESFPSGNSSFEAINSPASDVFDLNFSGKLENLATGSAALVKQANLGVGVIQPNQEVTISFWAKGSAAAGGVHFAEFFSELDGGGTSKAEILGSGPLPLTNTYTFFEFNTTTGADVSGGVTLQLVAATGANAGSFSTLFFDNVSIVGPTVIPEPTSGAMIAVCGLFAFMRRRRN